MPEPSASTGTLGRGHLLPPTSAGRRGAAVFPFQGSLSPTLCPSSSLVSPSDHAAAGGDGVLRGPHTATPPTPAAEEGVNDRETALISGPSPARQSPPVAPRRPPSPLRCIQFHLINSPSPRLRSPCSRSTSLTPPPPFSSFSSPCHLASSASIAPRISSPSPSPGPSGSPPLGLSAPPPPESPLPRPRATPPVQPVQSRPPGLALHSPIGQPVVPRPRRPAPSGPSIHTKFGSCNAEGGGGPARPSSAPRRPDPGPSPRTSPYLIPAPGLRVLALPVARLCSSLLSRWPIRGATPPRIQGKTLALMKRCRPGRGPVHLTLQRHRGPRLLGPYPGWLQRCHPMPLLPPWAVPNRPSWKGLFTRGPLVTSPL